MADAGFRLGVEGDLEFKRALEQIDAQIRASKNEIRALTLEYNNNGGSAETLRQKSSALQSAIDAQTKKVAMLEERYKASASAMGESDTKTLRMKATYESARAELAKMNSTLDDSGNSLKTAGQGAITFGDLLKANLLSDAILGGVKALGSALASLGNSLVDVAQDGIEYNAQMESYTASFTTMLGDAAKAQQLVTNLREQAAATPFGMTDLADATKTLMGFGISADEAQKRIIQLGDISQGNSERFKSLSLAFAQMSATGKLTGQDLNQMINAGFNPLEEIARKTGKSIGELKDEMSKGAISAQMVSDAFESATASGGRFYGAMEAQSATFSGQLSTLKDNVEALKGLLTEELYTALAESVMPMVNGWVTELTEAFEKDGTDGLIAALTKVVKEATEYLTQHVPDMLEVASQIITALINGIMAQLPEVASGAFAVLRQFLNSLLEALPSILLAGVEVVMQLAQGIADALPELIPAAVNAIMVFTQGLADRLPDLLQAGLDIVTGLVQGILNAIPDLVAALPKLIASLVEFILGAIPQISQAGVDLIISLLQDLPGIINGISEAIPELIDKIIGLILTNDNKEKMGDAGVELFSSLVNVPAIVEAVAMLIPNIVKGIIEKLSGKSFEEMFSGTDLDMMNAFVASTGGGLSSSYNSLNSTLNKMPGAETSGKTSNKNAEPVLTEKELRLKIKEQEKLIVELDKNLDEAVAMRSRIRASELREKIAAEKSLLTQYQDTLTKITGETASDTNNNQKETKSDTPKSYGTGNDGLNKQTSELTTALGKTTTAVESLGITIDNAAANAGIKIGDTVNEAAWKIINKQEEQRKIQELMVLAAERANKLMGVKDINDYRVEYRMGDDGNMKTWYIPKNAKSQSEQQTNNNTTVNVTVDVSKVKNLNDIMRIADDAKRSQRAGYVE